MGSLSAVLFGNVRFRETEEYLQFQFRFLIILMVAGSAFTVLFILGRVHN